MATYMKKFSTKVLTVVFFLSFTNATPEEECMFECIRNVERYCKTRVDYPQPRVSINAMLKYWGLFKEYYDTILLKMNIEQVLPRDVYCRSFITESNNCNDALINFGDSKKSAVTYALENTTLSLSRSNRFTFLYMISIMACVTEGRVRPPWTYCKIKCFPRFYEVFDWSPYNRGIENDEEDSDENETEESSSVGAAAAA